ncbi:hypothetical protein [Embleya sp. NPDC005575]|uniref:DUF3885 domain-containing protein n=1 Tax=Embleya sp. NPDC005575 TaxID=3156892 RepID=UPI0033A04780
MGAGAIAGRADGHVDLARLSADWRTHWGGCPPLGHLLKEAFPEKWVRFHSLPDSRRYARNDSEYRVLLERQHTVLADLGAPPRLVVVGCACGDGVEPAGRSRQLAALAPGAYWRSVRSGDAADPDVHVYAGSLPNTPAALDPLLRSVADDETAGVILAPVGLDWLAHPYDGGLDVIARSPVERDALGASHPDWLSRHPEGL